MVVRTIVYRSVGLGLKEAQNLTLNVCRMLSLELHFGNFVYVLLISSIVGRPPHQSFVLNSPFLNILVGAAAAVLIRWSATKVAHVSTGRTAGRDGRRLSR